MEHILEHYVYGYSANLRGFVFGFFHAAIMILGYYTGWSINRMLKITLFSFLILIMSSCSTKDSITTIRLAHSLDVSHPVNKAMVFIAKKVREKWKKWRFFEIC